jgi:hypothetical protein
MFIFQAQLPQPRAKRQVLSSEQSRSFTNKLEQIGFTNQFASQLAKSLYIPPGMTGASTTSLAFTKLKKLSEIQDIDPDIRVHAAMDLVGSPSNSVEFAINMEKKIKDPSSLFMVDNKPMTRAEIQERVTAFIQEEFIDKMSALQAMKNTLGLGNSSDEDFLKLIQNRFEGLSMAQLKLMGSKEFNSALSSFIKENTLLLSTFIEGVIRVKNSDNPGKEVYTSMGIQELAHMTAPTVIGVAFIDSLVNNHLTKARTFRGFGPLRRSTSFESNVGHLCYEVKNSYLGAACLPSAITRDIYCGVEVDQAVESNLNAKGVDYTSRARQLFSQDFVDHADKLARNFVSQLLSGDIAGGRGPIPQSVFDQLQMHAVIDDMKANSEFVSEISDKKRKEKERQDDDIKGGFA